MNMPSARLAVAAFCLAAARAFAGEPRLQDVMAAVSLDMNDDADFDRAILTQGEDGEADLRIFLSLPRDPKTNDDRGMSLALTKKNIGFSGSMWGQQPSLSVGGKGALLVKSENTGIGRNHFEQTLTIVFRNGEFLVAGVTYSAVDTLDPNGGGNCDVNLLSGTSIRNNKTAKGAPQKLLVSQWTDDSLPKACKF